MSKAYLISCSDHYDHRMQYWDRSLRALGLETVYLTSDFSHSDKKPFCCAVPGCVQLHVPPYRRNLSLARILSHRSFARQAAAYLRALPEPPAAVVCLVPPNFLCRELVRWRRRCPGSRLVFDLFDLWPETFPSSRLKRLLALPFRIWSGLRDRNLGGADFVTAECGYFLRRLGRTGDRARAVYFALPPYEGPEPEAAPLPRDRAVLGYLGAINHLIDIPRITALIRALSARLPVTLHVIGEGESRPAFCEAARDAGAEVVFHGKVYDEAEKHAVLAQCHFGLNIMKDSVCVGLTMKSVDYLRHGLPLLSSIGGDTAELLAAEGFGLPLRRPEETAAEAARCIQSGTEPLRRAARDAFAAHFSSSQAEAACTEVLAALLRPAEEA